MARRKAALGVPTRLDFSGRPHGQERDRASFADPALSKPPGPSSNVLREHREPSERPARPQRPDREAKARRHTASVHASKASDHVRVPRSPSNTGGYPSAERGEGGSAWPQEHARPSHMHPTPRGTRVSPGLAGVRKVARERRQEPFTARRHQLPIDRLRASFDELKWRVAPGVEGVTWQAYETGVAERRADLHRRVHGGA